MSTHPFSPSKSVYSTTRIVLTASFSCLLLYTSAQAQFTQKSLLDFETTVDGALPPTILHGHNSTPFTTSPVPVADPAISEVLAPDNLYTEVLGSTVLKFEPLEQEPHLSVVFNAYLDRSKLGTTGAALFESDFFVPAGSENHTIAIMASAYDENYGKSGKGYRFYRFGIQGDRVFFSFTDGTPSPVVFLRQSITEFNLQRPAWHRFQMAIHADGNIFCYIDGVQTSFSPIQETTLKEIFPGLMVTRYKESTGFTLADNLRISWSSDMNGPLPANPWTGSIGVATSATIDWDSTGIAWSAQMSEAWKLSSESKKPILVYAHDNEIANTQIGLAFLQSEEAKNFMNYVVPLRLNMYQKDNQSIAQKLAITETPTLMVLDPAGKPKASLKVDPTMTWPSIEAVLTQ